MTSSKKIIKHLKKLSKTKTGYSIELNETKQYWASKLTAQLEKENKLLKLLHYEKITNYADADILRNTARGLQLTNDTKQR